MNIENMKTKIKKMIACMLLGTLFAGVFMVGILISCGELTRLEGLAILGVGALVTFGYGFGIKEEK